MGSVECAISACEGSTRSMWFISLYISLLDRNRCAVRMWDIHQSMFLSGFLFLPLLWISVSMIFSLFCVRVSACANLHAHWSPLMHTSQFYSICCSFFFIPICSYSHGILNNHHPIMIVVVKQFILLCSAFSIFLGSEAGGFGGGHCSCSRY